MIISLIFWSGLGDPFLSQDPIVNFIVVIFLDSFWFVCILIKWSNFNLLNNYQWIIFPAQSCILLNSFCVSLLLSFIIWLSISSLYYHIIYTCHFVVYYQFLLWYNWFLCHCFVLLFRFLFLNHVQIILSAMS